MDANQALADRIEQAKGPSRELDVAIFRIVKPEYASDSWQLYGAGMRHNNDSSDMRCLPAPEATVPYYTSSIDAALTLVPEGQFFVLDGPRKYLNIPTPVPNVWRACIGYSPEMRGWGATPALAICAAALRTGASHER